MKKGEIGSERLEGEGERDERGGISMDGRK
jgi:hypothetical protein